MGTLAELKLILSVDGQGRVTGALNDVGASVDRAGQTTKTATERMAAGMGNVETATGRMANYLGSIPGLASTVATAFASLKLAEYVKDAVLLSARLETLGVVMGVVGNNAGYTASQMDAYAEGVARMGITTEVSRSTVIKMAQANIDLSKSADLARIAQNAAVIGNINSSEAFERMIHGIQSGQIDVLRTIGINVNFEQSYKKLADQMGKTSEGLTEYEKMQARTGVVMEAGTAISGAYEASMSTAGKQILSMKRYTEELRLALGQVGLPLMTAAVWEMVNGLKNADAWVKENKDSLTAWGNGLSTMYGSVKNILLFLASALDQVGIAAARAWQFLNIPAAISGNQWAKDQIEAAQQYIKMMDKRIEENRITRQAIISARAVDGPALDSHETTLLKGGAYNSLEQQRIAAGNAARNKKAAEEAKAAREKAAEDARQLAEKQAHYNKHLLDSELAIKEQETRMDIAREADALKQKLALLDQLHQLGLVSEQQFLDDKYNLNRAAHVKEMALLLQNAKAAYQEYSDLYDKPGTDDTQTNRLYDKYLKDWEAYLKKKREIAALDAIKPGQDDLQQLKEKKDQLAAEVSLLQAMGITVEATKTQIALDKINNAQLDARTKAIKEHIDALKLLKAHQDEVNAVNAVKNQTEDIKISTMNDPYEQQRASLEAKYARERELLEQQLELSKQGSELEKAQMEQLTALQIKLNKDLKDSKTAESQDAWSAVLKHASKAVPQLSAFDSLLAASFKDYTVKNKEGVVDETKTNLSMYGAYTSAAGDMFTQLAATQDTSSRQGFETAKDFNMAAAVMSTAAAIMNAMASIPYPMNIVAAAATAAMGAIQIAQIASTSFGGGAASASAPSGSFASSGGASSGSGLGNLQVPLMSIQDSQTEESLTRLTASTDNVSVVIGKLSKSLDDLTGVFEEGGAGWGLATNAPGLYGETSTVPGVMSQLSNSFKSGIKDAFNGDLFSALVLNPTKLIGNAIFGGKTYITGAGISLGVQEGQITGQNYLNKKKDRGWFRKDKSWTELSDNSELQTYMTALVKPYTNDISRMAMTLGTTANLSSYTVAPTKIATAGRKPEDVAKDLETWTVKTLQGMALTVEGLENVTGSYDDAYAKLREYNDALVSTNDALGLIGKTQLQGSLQTGEFLAAMQRDLFGGMDGFNEAIDTYFTNVFTDQEQKTAKAAQAQRQVTLAFAEMDRAVPTTREEFRNLVNGLEITTETGAQTFAALTSISEAFGTMMDAADAAAEHVKKVTQATEDLDVRYLKATGQDTEADALARQLSGQREIEAAIADNMGDAYIARLRDVLAAEAAVTEAVKDYTEQRQSLQEQLDVLNGTRTQREIDLAKITDTVSATLQQQIWAAQDLAAAEKQITDQRISLQQQLDVLTGTRTQREIDLAKITDATNAAIQSRIWALQDEKAATEKAAEAAKTAQAAAEQLLRRSIDAEIKTLQERADATAKAAADAEALLERSYAAQREIIVRGHQSILDGLQRGLDEATKTADTLKSSMDMLTSARKGMNLENAGAATMAAAQADLASILDAARRGDTSRIAGMSDTLSIVTKLKASDYASQADYQQAFWQTSNSIAELENITGGQLTDAQKQVQTLTDLLDATKTGQDAELAAYDAQLNAIKGVLTNTVPIAEARAAYEATKAANDVAQHELATQTAWLNAQYDMLTEVNNSVLSVADAITGLQTARAAAGSTPITLPTSSSGTSGGIPSGAYQLFGDTRVYADGRYEHNTGGYVADASGWYLNGVKLPGFALGGITSGPSIAGEAGYPEAVVPLPDGRSIPVRINSPADNKELLAELKTLNKKVESLESEIKSMNKNTTDTTRHTRRTADLIETVTEGGNAMRTAA